MYGDVKKQEIDYYISNCEHCCEFLLDLHREELDPSKGNRIWNHAAAVRTLIVLARRLYSRCSELEGKLAAVEHENQQFRKGIFDDHISKELDRFKQCLIDQVTSCLEDLT